MPELPSSPPSPLKCRLRFLFCLICGLALAGYALFRWSPMTDFSTLGHPDASPILATLDYAAASAFFVIGPMLLMGWRRWTFARPEGVPELIVLAVGSLMAGGLFLLLTVGAARGLLRTLP